MYNIVKRNRVKVRSVDYIGYDLLSINFTRNTVKRKNGIDEYPYAPLLTYSTRQRAVYLRVTCRIIMNPRNCINYPGLLTGLTVARNRSIDLCILYTNRIEFLIIAIDSQNVVYLIRVIICFLSIECPPRVEFRSIVKKSLIRRKNRI